MKPYSTVTLLLSVIATFPVCITDNKSTKSVSFLCVLLHLTSNRVRQSVLSESLFQESRVYITVGPAPQSHKHIDKCTCFWHIGAWYILCLYVPTFLLVKFIICQKRYVIFNVESFLIMFNQLHTFFFFYNVLTLFYSYLRHWIFEGRAFS